MPQQGRARRIRKAIEDYLNRELGETETLIFVWLGAIIVLTVTYWFDQFLRGLMS